MSDPNRAIHNREYELMEPMDDEELFPEGHHKYCPAGRTRHSTLCMCRELEAAEKAAEAE